MNDHYALFKQKRPLSFLGGHHRDMEENKQKDRKLKFNIIFNLSIFNILHISLKLFALHFRSQEHPPSFFGGQDGDIEEREYFLSSMKAITQQHFTF